MLKYYTPFQATIKTAAQAGVFYAIQKYTQTYVFYNYDNALILALTECPFRWGTHMVQGSVGAGSTVTAKMY